MVNLVPKFYFSDKPPLQNNNTNSEIPPTQGRAKDERLEKIDQILNEAEKKKTEFEDDASFERENSNTSIYIFAMGALGLALGYLVFQVNILRYDKKTSTKQNLKTKVEGKADIGGPWKLTDIQGNTFSDADLKGSYYLIYFGFCNCPDICPNSLHKLSKSIKLIEKMPEAKYIKLKSVFVSVDPDRDSPQRIEKFLNLFDMDMIGVTAESNDSPSLKDMMRKFRIYASKIEYEDDEQTDENVKKSAQQQKQQKEIKKKPYTIDHTVLIYLMDDQNEFVTYLGSNLNEFDMSQTIVDKILENERLKIRKHQN